MAKTPISGPNSDPRSRRERGAALLEATIALGLVAMIAAAGFAAFSQSARATARAEAKLEALAAAESAIERASHPSVLVAALKEGRFEISGDDWRVEAEPYEEDADGSLALIRLRAFAGPEDAPLVTLETLRTASR